MNYKRFYEEKTTEALERKEKELWQRFYNKTLPKRLESFKKSFKGNESELETALQGRREFLINCQADEISNALDKENERLVMLHFTDAINRLEQLTKDAPDNVEEMQDEENKSLASEIIADQAAEVQELQEKLAEVERDRDLFYEQKSAHMMQLDIVGFALQIHDPKSLKFAYNSTKVCYNQQRGEDDGEK